MLTMRDTNLIQRLDSGMANFDWKLAVIAIMVSVMVFARDLGFYAFTPTSFVIVFTIAGFLLPYRSLQAFFFFWIPFVNALHGITAAPLLIALVLKSKHNNFYQYVFSIAVLFLELMHLVTYPFSVDYIKYLFYGIHIFLFFFVLFDDSYDNPSINQCIKYYIVGTAVIFLVIIVHTILLYGIDETIYGALRLGGDKGLFVTDDDDTSIYASMNPNTLAYFSVTALALWLYNDDVFQSKVFKWALFALLALAGVLSASRTWIIIMLLLLVLYFITTTVSNKFRVVIVSLLMLVVAVQYNRITESFVSRFSERFEEDDLLTAGLRTMEFAEYNSFLLNNPEYLPLGTGALYYDSICGKAFSIHNGTQQIYVCYGVLGLSLYIICALIFFRRHRHKFRIAQWMPFIMCFLFDQSIQFLLPYGLMLPFVASLLPVKQRDSNVVH